MNKEETILRYKEIVDQYGWLVCDKHKRVEEVPEKLQPVIRDLLNIISYMDTQTSNMIVLADGAVTEANEFRRAILSVPEGVELSEYLLATKPDLFPSRMKRMYSGNA